MDKSKLFVIQKHDASTLHYDFRLRVDNRLVSWTVPKGLSTAVNEKRLAVRVDDHSVDYADFEGVIPEGEYGAGTVIVWDRGTYELLDTDTGKDFEQRIKDGSFKIRLKGEKIKGGYAMARTGEQDGKAQWVVFKLDDENADARRNPVSTEPDSVKTGRSLEDIRKDDNQGSRDD